jgi:hypothetical protein
VRQGCRWKHTGAFGRLQKKEKRRPQTTTPAPLRVPIQSSSDWCPLSFSFSATDCLDVSLSGVSSNDNSTGKTQCPGATSEIRGLRLTTSSSSPRRASSLRSVHRSEWRSSRCSEEESRHFDAGFSLGSVTDGPRETRNLLTGSRSTGRWEWRTRATNRSESCGRCAWYTQLLARLLRRGIPTQGSARHGPVRQLRK